ncbi:MAG TPA: tRNA (adenosine(37)-N6)-threonylcarbamoyltransferase complex dimerization subunit type 1 TsaB [Vicinamibacteria bacterium]|jgi:tRNA threonylcarbamoyladenosine biosynthesis protein TsaB
MRLLAVDTTSVLGSIAVLEGDTVRAREGFETPAGHAQRLLPEIDRILGSLGLSLADIEAFAVAVGPGSFTGLRIGIASVEGLAFATGRPVVGVSTLDATASRYRARARLVAPLLDARREEIYGALFRIDGDVLETVVDPVCERPQAFLARLRGMSREPIVFAGDAVALYATLVRRVMGELADLEESVVKLAEEVGRIGRKRLEEGEAAPLGGLRAQYLRLPDAQRTRR